MIRLRCTVLAAAAVTALAGCGSGDDPTIQPPPPGAAGDTVSAALVGADGSEQGTVEMEFTADGAVLTVQATGLPPGLHGLHVHKTGTCEPDSTDPAAPDKRGAFLSAGGHLAADGQTHGDHDGDLPSLLVRADGSARLVVASDRLTRENVLDADGSAVMVHAEADNFGNVPDRYVAQPDETTTKTGDAGARLACAALTG
ncbi:MAG: superoxide dismutase family protein [Mycobacteriales bacterium]